VRRRDRSGSHGRPDASQQEFAFFNGHYDTWCYLPVAATVTFDDEAAQFAVAAILRPGKAPALLGARGILRRLLRKLRAAFPAATFRVRLDGGFASPKLSGASSRAPSAPARKAPARTRAPLDPGGRVTGSASSMAKPVTYPPWVITGPRAKDPTARPR
jgi:hypothetical protein